MPALNFKAMFRSRVEDGTKRHTIRATRKRPWKVGEELALYTGMRTRACKLIFRSAVTRVDDIFISAQGDLFINEQSLTRLEQEELARADGFHDHAEMMRFWRENNTLPFRGQVIHWKFPGEVRA